MNTREWLQLVGGIVIVVIAIGFALRVASPGFAIFTNMIRSGVTGSPLLIPISTVVVNIGVVAGSVMIVQRVAKAAEKGLFTSVAATLSVLQGSFVSALSQLWGDMPPWGKLGFEAALVLLFAVAAFTWRRSSVIAKTLSVCLFLFPPLVIVARSLTLARASGQAVTLAALDGETRLILACLGGLALAAILAHYALPESEKA